MELPSLKLRPRLNLWSSCGIQPEYQTRVDEWGVEVEWDLIVQNAAFNKKTEENNGHEKIGKIMANH